jgi:hypothetical protein
MADTPQYTMNTGTSDQLPKGGAQDLNQASAVAAQAPGNNTLPEPANPVRVAATPPPVAPVSGDRNQALFGPTNRPNESVMTGVQQGGPPSPPPQSARTWLPVLGLAAADPNGSPTIKALYAALANLASQ